MRLTTLLVCLVASQIDTIASRHLPSPGHGHAGKSSPSGPALYNGQLTLDRFYDSACTSPEASHDMRANTCKTLEPGQIEYAKLRARDAIHSSTDTTSGRNVQLQRHWHARKGRWAVECNVRLAAPKTSRA